MTTKCSTLIAAMAALFITTSANAGAYVGSGLDLWNGGVVPYEWAPDMLEANKWFVLAAMQAWEDVANIQFIPHTNETDYLLIQNAADGDGSSSPVVGRGGGEQVLNVRQNWGTTSDNGKTYGMAHEVGHVLGFYHTHQRPDRETYLDVVDAMIADCWIGNYNAEETSLGWPRTAMDFDSVMSYGQCIFSTCNYDFDSDCACNDDDCPRYESRDCSIEQCCTNDTDTCRTLDIYPPNEDQQDTMGQRNHLSALDAKLMSFMYPETNWKFVEQGSPGFEAGTFHQPYKTFTTADSIVPSNSVVWIGPGNYTNSDGVYDRPMLVQATYGTVLIQQ